MNLRMGNAYDLPQLKEMYGNIIDQMNKNDIQIWDEIYPSEFFREDIDNNRLYILEENNEIAAAFALDDSNAGEEYVQWRNKQGKALYIDRLGVNINYSRRGIGSIMLNKAVEIAREKGFKYLRIFVVDINKPAINLYLKNGFKRAEGIYDEVIDDDLIFHEFGFEIEI